MTLTTTLAEIRKHKPCDTGWTDLLKHLGETKADDEVLPIATVLDSNGLDDCIRVLAYTNRRILVLWAADCAEEALHLFEAAFPDNDAPRKAIEAARNPDTTAARAARAARAVAPAWYAASAAWVAAAGDAYAAALDAAETAARAAAWDAAGAAKAAQEARLRQYLEHGEVAKDMEWGK